MPRNRREAKQRTTKVVIVTDSHTKVAAHTLRDLNTKIIHFADNPDLQWAIDDVEATLQAEDVKTIVFIVPAAGIKYVSETLEAQTNAQIETIEGENKS